MKFVSEEDKVVELAMQLIRATEEGRLAWRPTARIDEFSTTIQDRYSVLVSKELSGAFYLQLLDEDGRELFQVSITREYVAKWTHPPAERDPIQRLFDLARRNALRVDQAIDEVLEGLKRR